MPRILGGRRYHTIRDLMVHMRTCHDETFYDAAQHLHNKNWVEAPKNQHIVINEEATNVVLKTTGLWLMPEPPDHQINTDALRGFWVMPSSTSDYIDHQEQLRQQQEQLRQQQEKLRLEQEAKRIAEEQARLEREEQARLQRAEEERQLQLQRQLLEEQQKLRLQQQLQEQQKQLLLQQQQQHYQRQSHSVVQGISSVPIVKSSPTVISHQNASNIQTQRSQAAAANTIIVLNDEQIFSQTGTDGGLRCIQASDGSYHVIGNVDLNDRHMTNATSVIAHTTSPVLETQVSVTPPAALPPPPPPAPTGARKRRGGRQPKQNINVTYTQQNTGSDLITLENVYQTHETSITPVVPNKPGTTTKRRRGGQQAVDQSANVSIEASQGVIQNVEVADMPPQQFYIAYNDNGVLVPIDTSTGAILESEAQSNAVDLSQEQYIIEDLDASRKAQQKSQSQRGRSTARAAATSTVMQPMATTSTATVTAHMAEPSGHAAVIAENGAADMSAYNIDDLSHLDKPIASAKPSNPIKPLNSKPQFMDSFFSFLMNRESNKL